MKFRRNVAVFIRKQENNSIVWDCFTVKNALVTATLEANSNISAKGLVPNSKVIVRFPPDKRFSLKPGDSLFIGGTELKSPPNGSFNVLSVTGGDRGSRTLKLIKAVCG